MSILCPLPLQVDAREPRQQSQRGSLSHCMALEGDWLQAASSAPCRPSVMKRHSRRPFAPAAPWHSVWTRAQPQTPTPVVAKGGWPRPPAGRRAGVTVLTGGLRDLVRVEGDVPQPPQSSAVSCPDGLTGAWPNPHSEWAPVGTPASQ